MPEMRNDAVQAAQGYKCDSRCKCGQYPGHLELDKAYLNNEISLQEYADRVGCKSRSSVERHVKGHLPGALLKATDIKDVANGDSLLDELKKARDRTFSLLDKAEAAADTRVYGAPVAYLKEIREQLKFIAELEGKISSQPQITIINNPEWIELRTVIVQALDPYPEAKEAVVHAIRDR
jgi:ABC-type phosphate transport system auxiliary subunit